MKQQFVIDQIAAQGGHVIPPEFDATAMIPFGGLIKGVKALRTLRRMPKAARGGKADPEGAGFMEMFKIADDTASVADTIAERVRRLALKNKLPIMALAATAPPEDEGNGMFPVAGGMGPEVSPYVQAAIQGAGNLGQQLQQQGQPPMPGQQPAPPPDPAASLIPYLQMLQKQRAAPSPFQLGQPFQQPMQPQMVPGSLMWGMGPNG